MIFQITTLKFTTKSKTKNSLLHNLNLLISCSQINLQYKKHYLTINITY